MTTVLEDYVKPGEDGYIAPANSGTSESVRECETVAPEGSYGCTRERGHTGRHVAHGSADDMLASWANPLPNAVPAAPVVGGHEVTVTDADMEWMAQAEGYERRMAERFQAATNFDLAAQHSISADRYARIASSLHALRAARAEGVAGGHGITDEMVERAAHAMKMEEGELMSEEELNGASYYHTLARRALLAALGAAHV